MKKLNSRSPMQVSDAFADKLREIRRKIRMMTGNDKSLRQLTEEIIKNPAFADIEKNIINNKGFDMDIKIKFDRRMYE